MFVVLITIFSTIWRVNVNSANALLNFLTTVPEGGSEGVKISLALEEAIVALLRFLPFRVCFSPPFSLAFVFRGICYVSRRLRYFSNKYPLITSCLNLCYLMDCCMPCFYSCLGLVLTYFSSPIREGVLTLPSLTLGGLLCASVLDLVRNLRSTEGWVSFCFSLFLISPFSRLFC